MKVVTKNSIALLITLLISALASYGQAPAQSSQAAEGFRAHVSAISAGRDNAARGAAIAKRLEELGIKFRREPFTKGESQGTNIIAQLSGKAGQKELMLGAHYDRVPQGAGAIDNASGSAAVLELLAALKANPLKNYSVTAVFFDLEEIGLLGSRNYVEAHEQKGRPAIFINFDVFGYGDTLWVGTRDPKTAAASAITRVANATKFPLEIGQSYPPSDHLSFARAGIESLSFSLIDGEEIPGILKVFKSQQPDAMPRVLTIIHSSGDTADKIDAAAVAHALPIVEQAIRAIDAP